MYGGTLQRVLKRADMAAVHSKDGAESRSSTCSS
jgi:hypothetical protein